MAGAIMSHTVGMFTEYDLDEDGFIKNEVGRPLRSVYKFLREKLEAEDLIDEYFSISHDQGAGARWPVGYHWIAVFPVTGGSEGHYVHVESITGERRTLLFLAKTFQGIDQAWRIARVLGDALDV